MILILHQIMLVVCLALKHISVEGAALAPSGTVQYVFNVPTDLQGGNPSDLQAAITNLQEQVTVLSKRLRYIESNGTDKVNIVSGGAASASGANFVHWGKKSCTGDSNLIYTGLTAKTYYNNVGGGINYQCLPMDPEFPDGKVSGHQSNTYIQAVEILALGVEGINPSSENYNDVSCSVCETTRKQTLMIPAKRTCPTGWHKEYEGHLMAERYNHNSPSTFICVDKDVEYFDGGVENRNSGYVVPVEIDCHSIPCPPYSEGYELSCVVCSK